VTVRGAHGSFVVPQGSFAMAAAAAPPSPNDQGAKKDDDDDDDKGGAVLRKPKRSGRAAGAGAKGGWKIGSLGHWTSVALVTGGTAAAITGAATTLTNDPASPQD